MAFTQDTFATVGAQASDTPTVYSYKSDDSLDTILTDGYFSDKQLQLEENDIVLCQTGGEAFLLEISADTSSAMIPSSSGQAQSVVTVNSLDNFAVQDATTITLEEGKAYRQVATIQSDKRYIIEPDVAIVSDNPSGAAVWDYTGTGDMFTGTNVGFLNMTNFSYIAENANQVFNLIDTTPQTTIWNMNTCIGYSKDASSRTSKKFGTVTNLLTVDIVNSGAVRGLGVDDGLTLGGTQQTALSISKLAFLSTSATFVGLDLGNVVVTTAFEISNFVNIGLTPGSIGIKGLTSSGNVGTGIIGTIRDSEFIGAITPLDGVSRSDIRLEVINSAPVNDSIKSSDSFLTASRTTPITVQSQFEVIGGADWTSDVIERFTTDTAGLMTYVSEISACFLVVATATVEKVSGGTNELAMRISQNGTTLAKSQSVTRNTTPTSVTSIAIVILESGATLGLEVANLSGTADIIVSDANISAIEG